MPPPRRADGKAALFDRCEDLFASGLMEESFIAGSWLPRLSGEFDREDLDRFALESHQKAKAATEAGAFANEIIGVEVETPEGKIVHSGARTAIAEGRLVGSDGKLYAHATTTCFILQPEKK